MVCTTNRKALIRAARVVLSHYLFRPPFGGPGRTNILLFPKKKKKMIGQSVSRESNLKIKLGAHAFERVFYHEKLQEDEGKKRW